MGDFLAESFGSQRGAGGMGVRRSRPPPFGRGKAPPFQLQRTLSEVRFMAQAPGESACRPYGQLLCAPGRFFPLGSARAELWTLFRFVSLVCLVSTSSGDPDALPFSPCWVWPYSPALGWNAS